MPNWILQYNKTLCNPQSWVLSRQQANPFDQFRKEPPQQLNVCHAFQIDECFEVLTKNPAFWRVVQGVWVCGCVVALLWLLQTCWMEVTKTFTNFPLGQTMDELIHPDSLNITLTRHHQSLWCLQEVHGQDF